jgi:hypothetical protein
VPPAQASKFAILQMRPIVLNRELEILDVEHVDQTALVCRSGRILGNGILDNIFDIVVVDRDRFDRSKSRDAAAEVTRMNAKLATENRQYLLIGVGRWGSLDPWLGIPVTWNQISGARAIVEAGFKDFTVMPSQGTHFFQNLNSFLIGYFTVGSSDPDSFIDWEWLSGQPAAETLRFVRHLRFDRPIRILMSGHQNKGIVFKPEHARA